VPKSPFKYYGYAGGCAVVLLVALLVLFVGALQAYATLLTGSSSTKEGGDAGVRDNSCTGLFYPNITNESAYAESINEFIKKRKSNSPLNGLGDYFVSGGKKSGINPSLIVAHALKESTLGTAGIATRGTHNAFGRKATDSQPGVELSSGRWYKWSSWRASLDSKEDDHPTYIHRQYISGDGLFKETKLKPYISHYCPKSDNCNTDLYVDQIQQWMQEIADGSNGGVTCE